MILSILMISLGVLILFLSIRDYNKNVMNKYKKIKFLSDIMFSIFYIIAGILLLLKIITGKYIGIIVVVFCIIDMIIGRKIKNINKNK